VIGQEWPETNPTKDNCMTHNDWVSDVLYLHHQGKGRWLVEVVTPARAISAHPHLNAAAGFAASVREGREPLCACCDYRWDSQSAVPPALLFIATPGGNEPEGGIVCGVCEDCADTKDMRQEARKWIGSIYRDQVTTEDVRRGQMA
jgi:hypothetical protein